MGIVHDAARYLPDLLDYMAEHYPSLTVKNGVLGRSSDIETTTMVQYKDQVGTFLNILVCAFATINVNTISHSPTIAIKNVPDTALKLWMIVVVNYSVLVSLCLTSKYQFICRVYEYITRLDTFRHSLSFVLIVPLIM